MSARLQRAMPKRDELEAVHRNGIRSIYQEQARRSLAFLQEHGRCLDLLELRKSTIPQSGRDAFATRNIATGDIITGSPLLLVPNRKFFEMYEGDWEKKEDEPNYKILQGLQVMINYCWSHKETSIFLCPYGTGIHNINHTPAAKTNARVRWANNKEICPPG